MGVDVTILFDVGIGAACPNEVLARMSAIYPRMVFIWDSAAGIPSNAGFKALDIERFRADYAQGWRMTCGDSVSRTGQSGSDSCELIGPYGFFGNYFNDILVLDHFTRWAAFESDEIIRQRFIDTAQLVAEALGSTTIVFTPDSGYVEAGCLDLLSNENRFRDLFQWLIDHCEALVPVTSLPASQPWQMFAVDVQRERVKGAQ